MSLPILFALLAVQQQQQPTLPPSPIARIEITPRTRSIVAGDSLRLQARALDASGRPVPDARVFFHAQGGQMEGHVDTTGMVVASTIGKTPIVVTAFVPGSRPVIDSIELHTVPGPATRVEVATKARRLVVGQQLRLTAIGYSARNDRARQPI